MLTIDLTDKKQCQTALAVIGFLHADLVPASGPSTVAEAAAEQTAAAVAAVAPSTAQISTNPEDRQPVQEAAGVDATAGVELDKNGTPWIKEVHSGNQKKTTKGVWQKKRGVDDQVLADAEAAARAKIAGTPAPTEQVQAPVAAAQPAEQPAAAAAAVATPAAEVISVDLMSQVYQDAVAAGVTSADQAMALYAELGIDPAQLAVNETARATLVNHLRGLMAAASNVAVMPGVVPGMPG